MEEFLHQISLQSGEENESQKDKVKLMTIHQAKGLEFPVVFILGLSEGIFPSVKTIEERKERGLEEERRLCYVAITRAKKHLFLMDSEGKTSTGATKQKSRFLVEIGEENYKRIGVVSENNSNETNGLTSRTNLKREPEFKSSLDRKIGELVVHHVFGSGVIQDIDDNKGNYIVKFDSLAQPRSITRMEEEIPWRIICTV